SRTGARKSWATHSSQKRHGGTHERPPMSRHCNDGVGEMSETAPVASGIAGQGGLRRTMARTPMDTHPSRGRVSPWGLPETASERGDTPGAELCPEKDLRILQWGRELAQGKPFTTVRICARLWPCYGRSSPVGAACESGASKHLVTPNITSPTSARTVAEAWSSRPASRTTTRAW